MLSLSSTKKYILLIIAASLLTHFIFIWHPAETVFDEVHFGKFINGYITGKYFFDIHPPLGKLIYLGAAKVIRFDPTFSFDKIGTGYTNNSYVALRLIPAFFGAAFSFVIFLLALELGIRRRFALLGAFFVTFENALIAQSRFILLDAFLLFFGFLALFLYLRSRRNTHNIWLSAVFAAFALSVKWTGLGFLALIGIWEFIRFIQKKKIAQLKNILILSGIPAVIYFVIFTFHFMLLPSSGPGNAFHTPAFRKTLRGSEYENRIDIEKKNFFGKFFELNKEMYYANQRLDAAHPYASAWYTWPFMARTIYYWNNDESGQKIYLIGNPTIWWSSTISIIMAIVLLVNNFFKKQKKDRVLIFLLLGYAINFFPFAGIKRIMFLYHYFPAYIFAILVLIYLLNENIRSKEQENGVVRITVLTAMLCFLFFSPLTYGYTIPDWYYRLTTWFGGWI